MSAQVEKQSNNIKRDKDDILLMLMHIRLNEKMIHALVDARATHAIAN